MAETEETMIPDPNNEPLTEAEEEFVTKFIDTFIRPFPKKALKSKPLSTLAEHKARRNDWLRKHGKPKVRGV